MASPRILTMRTLRRTLAGLSLPLVLVAAWVFWCSDDAHAQARAAAHGMGTASTPVATPAAPREPRPLWTELTPAQQQALAPLSPHWSGLTEPHKRKWLALSRNFDRMSPEVQAKLQERMIDWSKLSTAERNQARFNYAETSRLAPDDRKARWEAYQALSEEERSKLAAAAGPARPAGAAPAIKPGPVRLARVPSQEAAKATGSRIGVSAKELDHNTLLPQHPAYSEGTDGTTPAALR